MSKNIYQKIERGEVNICQTCIHRLVCRAIDNQPCTECNHYQNAADVAPVRHGRWEFPIFADSDDELDPRVKCSECGSVEAAFARWKYCPNCGARMDKETNT